MTDTIKNLATPLGWKDTFVRAAKTAIAYFIVGLPGLFLGASWYNAATGGFNIPIDVTAAVGLVGGAFTTGGSIILNAVLKWANS